MESGTRRCWGIFRERDHSPERESDDEAILLAVADRLRADADVAVEVYDPGGVPAGTGRPPDLIFYMCEADHALDLVEGWRRRGILTVNTPESVRNTLRHASHRLLRDQPFFPPSWMVPTWGEAPNMPDTVWVKRGGYHATTREDVLRVVGCEQLRRALASFRERGIETVLVQSHVEGDLIKFYGVVDRQSGVSRWFHWFYHRGQELVGYSFDPEGLRRVCEKAAGLLGLEVYGGDAIVTPQGALQVIDVNAWPSFALYRDEASRHIAALLLEKLARALPTSGLNARGGRGVVLPRGA